MPSWRNWHPPASLREALRAGTHIMKAEVVELADTHGSGPCAARREGSSPSFSINIIIYY